jgi:SAM-dependent methyltransferase
LSKEEQDAGVAVLRGARRHADRPWYRSAASTLERHRLRGLTCLDLCAGNAEFSELLRDRFAMRVTCADYAPAHLEHQRSLGFDTLRVDLDGSATEVDRTAAASAGAFDIVVSLATIEHVFDSDSFLRFCHTVLKPGGLLLVNTPNIAFGGYRLFSRLSGGRPFGEGHHVRFFDFRFLRTNLFLNGFGVIDDARGYFGLPTDVMTRAFRGRRRAASAVARLFGVCRGLQRVPGLRGWSTDELTVLARREAAYPIGFQYWRVRSLLDGLRGRPEHDAAVARLREARRRDWLDEHLMLKALTDEAGARGSER